MTTAVLKLLEQGAVLLTSTSQLAADWKRRYAKAQPADACETPKVYSWKGWLGELAAQIPSDISLNPLQEQQLWEQVIHNDSQLPKDMSEASLRGLARHSARAYALMCEYGIQSDDLALSGEESEALARWIEGIQIELKRDTFKGRCLAADIGAGLCRHIEDVTLARQILLDGFDRFTPMQQQIVDAMQAAGCEITQVEPSVEETVPTLTVCADEQAEQRHIAMRLKALLDDDPHARIAVLSCEQSPDTNSLSRVLNAALIPEEALNPARTQFAIAMTGEVLSDMPMIRQLMHMLSVAGKPHLEFSDFSRLLFCPWLKGYAKERFERAELDARFRSWNRHRLTWPSLLKTKGVQELPQLHAALEALAGWRHGRKNAGAWVQEVLGLLQATGFVQTTKDDDHTRSNADVRQMNAFRDVLIAMVAADAVSAAMSWGRFFSMLRGACSEVQLTSASRYPNVVMMPLSAIAGLRFDHVLIMGASEEALPPSPRPQPLLPLHLQQEYAIAMSTAPLAYAHSCWLWQQLLVAAPVVEISYARQKDERELLPSPFAAGLPEMPCILPEPDVLQAEQENFADTPKVPVLDGEPIHGGTAIIRSQSACPFRAFAAHRLGMAGLEKTEPGIKPTTKGSLIHLALEFIWTRLKSRQALEDMNGAGRAGLIDAAVDHVFKENRSHPDFGIQAVEKKRMHRVLNDWLEIEMARPDFEVIETEAEYDLQLPRLGANQFDLDIKADRLDVDAAGHRILIDYKTGPKQRVSKWLGERMQEPQLPLYALAAGVGANDAVTYACLRSGDEMGFNGLAAGAIGIEGVTACDGKNSRPDDWKKVLDDWGSDVDALAKEFVEGRSDVSPRDEKACDYCGFEALCRVAETGFDADAGGDT